MFANGERSQARLLEQCVEYRARSLRRSHEYEGAIYKGAIYSMKALYIAIYNLRRSDEHEGVGLGEAVEHVSEQRAWLRS